MKCYLKPISDNCWKISDLDENPPKWVNRLIGDRTLILVKKFDHDWVLKHLWGREPEIVLNGYYLVQLPNGDYGVVDPWSMESDYVLEKSK